MIEYLLGVDGGGTGTRVAVAQADGTVLAQGQAGPSALGQGIDPAWQHILQAVAAAFASIGRETPVWTVCAMGAGLSGINHRPWADEFQVKNPGFAKLAIDTDAHTMLLGAHGGQPGAMVAAGTGSVGEVLRDDGSRNEVSGWGFPAGDEGSGAWLGLRAMAIAQQALDLRRPASPLAIAVQARCGSSRDALQSWCAQARQFEYAQLARLVFECAPTDPAANDLLIQAAAALDAMALAMDPGGTLPLALCGSIGQQLKPRLSKATLARCVDARFDAPYGALLLIRKALEAPQ
jgi:glucosamine kinase